MNLRIIGAALVIAGCAAVGFSIAAGYRREEQALQSLILAIEYMICQLRYGRTALPELCAGAADGSTGQVKAVLTELSRRLSGQSSDDAQGCMAQALEAVPKLPEAVQRNLRILGTNLGRFDAEGQLRGLQSVEELAQRDLAGLRCGLDGRIRACRTLGLCAGAAIAILIV